MNYKDVYIYYFKDAREGNIMWIYYSLKSLGIPNLRIFLYVQQEEYDLMHQDSYKLKERYNNLKKNIYILCPDLLYTNKLPTINEKVWISLFYNSESTNDLITNYLNLDYDINIIGGYFQNTQNLNLSKIDIKCPIYLQNYIKNKYIKDNKDIVNINIRRADFLQEEYNKRFNICGLSYYWKIIRELGRNEKYFIITSDDIEWCRKEFDQPNIKFVEEKDNPLKPLIDFFIPYFCDIQVLSNSSYNWWSAIHNTKLNKRIICPDRYMNVDYFDNSKVIFNNWEVVETI